MSRRVRFAGLFYARARWKIRRRLLIARLETGLPVREARRVARSSLRRRRRRAEGSHVGHGV